VGGGSEGRRRVSVEATIKQHVTDNEFQLAPADVTTLKWDDVAALFEKFSSAGLTVDGPEVKEKVKGDPNVIEVVGKSGAFFDGQKETKLDVTATFTLATDAGATPSLEIVADLSDSWVFRDTRSEERRVGKEGRS